jgi:hypothetical protein
VLEVKGNALYFTALPHGLHVEEVTLAPKWDGQEALAVIAICSGAILRRSTNGQMCFAQHDTKEPLTGWHSSLTPLLDEAAKARLKFAAPEIVSLISKAGEKIYERADNSDSNLNSNHSTTEPI